MSACKIISYASQLPTGLTTCGGVLSAASAAAPDSARAATRKPKRMRPVISLLHGHGGEHLAVKGVADPVPAGKFEEDAERLSRLMRPGVFRSGAVVESPIAALTPDPLSLRRAVGDDQPVADAHPDGIRAELTVLDVDHDIGGLRRR